MKNRYLIPIIQEICFPLHKMAFISGPRQCGKTTMAKMMLKDRNQGDYGNWDDVEFRRLWTKNPSDFIFYKKGVIPLVIFDEIHKAKFWKRNLKGVYDTLKSPVDILVTGSARLNVYKKGSDSLVGRYFHFRLHPFTLAEIQKIEPISPDKMIDQIFSRALSKKSSQQKCFEGLNKFGGFPEPFLMQKERQAKLWRKTRLERVIREDLRDLTRLPELSQIEMLASLIPERVGSFLSRARMREMLEVSFDTISRWINYLRELYYIFEIKPYQHSIARSLKKEGKIYLWDYSEVVDPAARFENLIACHLLKFCHYWTDYGEGDFELYCLRNKDHEEIDFLICRNKKPWLPIEVKLNDDRPSVQWAKFLKQLPCRKALQIVFKSNCWKKYEVINREILVGSAAEVLAYFV